jgi:dihydrodipicolinate synthase/N-acetylneuraminate lyase
MSTSRFQLLQALFPEGVPSLWCPPLTHYTRHGEIDHVRMRAHLRFMAPWVRGLLVPGTTGDGWELTPDEVQELMDLVLAEVPNSRMHLLWGALHPNAGEARNLIQAARKKLALRAGTRQDQDALRSTRVCGFAICPPRGADLSQPDMETALANVLEAGAPVALYQLPQLTQNEMSPGLVARLAARFSNFILLKDTSGGDRVASAGLDLGGVHLVRGMEGGYARWLKVGGGSYDGFLLSSANSFGRHLHELRDLLAHGRPSEANLLSDRLTSLIEQLFAIVANVPAGNKFTNANKLADHFYAYGPRALSLPPPRLHAGDHLTAAMVRTAGAALEAHQLMPGKGYLD